MEFLLLNSINPLDSATRDLNDQIFCNNQYTLISNPQRPQGIFQHESPVPLAWPSNKLFSVQKKKKKKMTWFS